MSGSIKVGGNTIATHTGAQGAGEVTLTADTAVIEGSSSGDLVRITQTGTGNALVVEDSANPDSTPFVVTSDGKVGIGTNNPAQIFHLQGSGVAARIDNSDLGSNVYGDILSDTGGLLTLRSRGGASSHGSIDLRTWNGTDDLSRMRIDSSGNVGVGTTTIDSLLHLEKIDLTAYDATATDGQVGVGPTIYLENPSNDNSTVGGQIVFGMRSTEEQARIGATGGTAPALTFGTADAERMRITSSGDVLLRTTSSTIDSTNNGTNLGVVFKHSRAASSGSAVAQFFGNTGECRILGDGDVINTNDSYGVISDIKLKENIVDAAPKLSDICNIRIVNYNLKTNPKQKLLGVIAQEVETIFPGIISEIIDEDSEGNDLGTTTKYVKTSVFIPMLIKAIQEQQTIIEFQQSQIDALTARIEALETQPT